MTEQQVTKGVEIIEQIRRAKVNLSVAESMISSNVVERDMRLSTNVGEAQITIPSIYFRSLGQMMKSEYEKRISELNSELEKL
jgi:hypothetical protein